MAVWWICSPPLKKYSWKQIKEQNPIAKQNIILTFDGLANTVIIIINDWQ